MYLTYQHNLTVMDPAPARLQSPVPTHRSNALKNDLLMFVMLQSYKEIINSEILSLSLRCLLWSFRSSFLSWIMVCVLEKTSTVGIFKAIKNALYTFCWRKLRFSFCLSIAYFYRNLLIELLLLADVNFPEHKLYFVCPLDPSLAPAFATLLDKWHTNS